MARPVDLTAEWDAFRAAACFKDFDDLKNKCGLPVDAIVGRVRFGQVRIEGDYFVPDVDGVKVMIIACFKHPLRLPDGRWRFPNEIIDLVAFSPETPTSWWFRYGNAAVLGEEVLYGLSVDPVNVRRDPLVWLRTGAAGICPVALTRNPSAVRDVIVRLPGMYVDEDDADLGRRLQGLLEQQKVPPIYVISRTGGAA